MSDPVLSTPGSLLQRMRVLDCLVAIPAVVVIVFYDWSLLDLSPAEWSAFGWTIAVYAALAAVSIEALRMRSTAPLMAWLGREVEGEDVDPALAREAFRVAVAQPRSGVLRLSAAWLMAPPVLCLGMWIGTRGDIGFDGRFFIVVVSTGLGAMISSAFLFFATKRLFADVRSRLADRIPDTAERAGLVVQTSLARKVQYVVLGAVIGTSLLVVTLAQSQACLLYTSDAADE
mgnify:CR=1 FL=1